MAPLSESVTFIFLASSPIALMKQADQPAAKQQLRFGTGSWDSGSLGPSL